MDTQDDDIRWGLYPHVAGTPAARAFLDRLRRYGRRPKTLDAYARNLDRFLAAFGGAPPVPAQAVEERSRGGRAGDVRV